MAPVSNPRCQLPWYPTQTIWANSFLKDHLTPSSLDLPDRMSSRLVWSMWSVHVHASMCVHVEPRTIVQVDQCGAHKACHETRLLQPQEWKEVMDLGPLNSDHSQCMCPSNPSGLLELPNKYVFQCWNHTRHSLILSLLWLESFKVENTVVHTYAYACKYAFTGTHTYTHRVGGESTARNLSMVWS